MGRYIALVDFEAGVLFHVQDSTDQAEHDLFAQSELDHPPLDMPGELPEPLLPAAPVHVAANSSLKLSSLCRTQQ
ncbi:hypothetical protein D3C76_1650300 [compost metagenome]